MSIVKPKNKSFVERNGHKFQNLAVHQVNGKQAWFVYSNRSAETLIKPAYHIWRGRDGYCRCRHAETGRITYRMRSLDKMLTVLDTIL